MQGGPVAVLINGLFQKTYCQIAKGGLLILRMFSMRRLVFSVLLVSLVFALASGAWAADEEPDMASQIGDLTMGLDTAWVLIAGFLVFLMQAGFAMVEAGFTRAKNACNILFKNYADFSVAAIMFFLVGFGFMFGKDAGGFIGVDGFMLAGVEDDGIPAIGFYFFQMVFCATAATIVSGGVAERMKFPSYLAYTLVLSAVVYPIIGHWIWGGGWLAEAGFHDFAGSTVVHATGGWAALAGTLWLGPRIGKYASNGEPKAILGHSIPLAALGVFLLWFGWFGFNPGSNLAVGDGTDIARIAATTNLAAAGGAVAAMIMVWVMFGKPDLSMTMNGALAGLVAITAPCAVVTPGASIIIGLLAGIIVVLSVVFFDRIKVDDPVGAISVHGTCGAFGTICVGLFGLEKYGLGANGLFVGGGASQLWVQLYGTVAAGAFAFVAMGIVFGIIKAIMGLRVTPEEELRGLDIGEHGMEAYGGFSIYNV